MRLLVNDLKLYFGLMFLLPLTLAGHKLHLTLPAGSFFHLLVFLTLIGGPSNNDVISSHQDKYYAVFLLRMDPAPSVSASDFTNYSNGGSAP